MSEENNEVIKTEAEISNEILFSTRFHFCTRETLKTYYQVGTKSDGYTQVNLVVDFDNYRIHLGPGNKFHRQISADADLSGSLGAYSFVITDDGPLFIHRHGRKLENKEREFVIKILKDILGLE